MIGALALAASDCVAGDSIGLHESDALEVESKTHFDHYLVHVGKPEVASYLAEEMGFGLVWPVPPELASGADDAWLAYLEDEEIAALAELGFEAEPADPATLSVKMRDGVMPLAPPDACTSTPANGTFCPYDGPNIPRCPTNLLTEIDSLPGSHPPIGGFPYLEVVTVGSTIEGRLIKAVRVGRIWRSGDPVIPQVVLIATQHAKEWGATEMTMRLLRYYADSYRDNTNGVRALLADRTILIVPVVNPDGYRFTFPNHVQWRKNRRACAGSTGVDPNRNFSFAWGQPGMMPNCSGDEARGPAAASEHETAASRVAISNFLGAGQYETGFVLNAHTYGNTVVLQDGLSSVFNPCTTNSNCSAPDAGALRALVGTEASVRLANPTDQMVDEESGDSYVVDSGYRALYAASGTLNQDVEYGVQDNGAPRALSSVVELTWTQCAFNAEQLPPAQLASLFTIFRRFATRLLGFVDDLADETFYAENVGSAALPHIHRRSAAGEAPTFRVGLLKALENVTFDGGVGGEDDVLDGVHYRQWWWRPDPGGNPYQFPREIEIQFGSETLSIWIDGGGAGFTSLCDPTEFTGSGWTFTGDLAGGPRDECYWRLSSSGAGPWAITSQPRDLTTVAGTHLNYSFSKTMSDSFTMSVLVSSNEFTNCDDDNWGTCRLVRQYPYSNSFDIRTGNYRTETIDISDFDGQQNVKIRFSIGTAPNQVFDTSFRIYDVVMVAR